MKTYFLWISNAALILLTTTSGTCLAREGTIPLKITGSIITGKPTEQNKIILQVPIELNTNAEIPNCSPKSSNRTSKSIGKIEILNSTKSIESICKNENDALYYLKVKNAQNENMNVKGIIRKSK